MEIKNIAVIKLLKTIEKFYLEIKAKPKETYETEDDMIERIIYELKVVADKYAVLRK